MNEGAVRSFLHIGTTSQLRDLGQKSLKNARSVGLERHTDLLGQCEK